jgi:hypothetical protein
MIKLILIFFSIEKQNLITFAYYLNSKNPKNFTTFCYTHLRDIYKTSSQSKQEENDQQSIGVMFSRYS